MSNDVLKDPSWIGHIATPTGLRETTGLQSHDAGVGRWLISIFQGMTVTDSVNNKSMASFFKRPPAEQIYMSGEDEPAEFLNRLRASKQGRQGADLPPEQSARLIRDAMPLVYFKRAVGVRFDDSGVTVKATNASQIIDSNDNAIANVNHSYLTLTYTVNFLAWDLESLSRLQTAFSTHLLHGKQHHFDVNTMLLGEQIPLSGTIMFPSAISFDDSSITQHEGRILCASCEVEVIGEVLEAVQVTEQKAQWAFVPPNREK